MTSASSSEPPRDLYRAPPGRPRPEHRTHRQRRAVLGAQFAPRVSGGVGVQCQRIHLAASSITLRRGPAQPRTSPSLPDRDRLYMGLWQPFALQPKLQIAFWHVTPFVPGNGQRKPGLVASRWRMKRLNFDARAYSAPHQRPCETHG